MARAPVSKTGGWGFESLHSCQVGMNSSDISMHATKRAASLAPPLWPPQQSRQLCDVGRDLARFLAGEQLCCRAPARLVVEVHVGKRLAVAIPNDDTGVEFFCGPWREKTVGHDGKFGPNRCDVLRVAVLHSDMRHTDVSEYWRLQTPWGVSGARLRPGSKAATGRPGAPGHGARPGPNRLAGRADSRFP